MHERISASSSAAQLGSRLAPALAAAAVMALGAWMWSLNQVAYDDSYIAYQYAQNWVDGNGIVFNVGERVEGFSDPLWVALSALVIALGFDPYVAMSSVGVASYLAAIGMITFAAGRRARPLGLAGLGLVPALGCLILPDGLAAMSGSGLETSFVALCLVSLGLLCLLPDGAWLSRVFGSGLPLLAVMTRLDAMIGLVAIVMTDATRFMRGEGDDLARARARILWRVVPSVVGLILLFGFRRFYYGEWMPNPYFAKGADEWHFAAGIAYLVTFAKSTWQLFPLLAFGAFGALVGHTRGVRRLCTYGLLIALGYALYTTKVGGDFMHYRFAWAPYLCLTAGGLVGLVELARRQPAAASVMALALGLLSLNPAVLEDDYAMQSLEEMHAYTELGREVGPALREHLPAGTIISTTLVGTISYYSGLHVVDQWGLNDYEVARSEGLPRFQRGHYKSATAEYLRRRKVELVVGHPEVCPCDDLCVENTPLFFMNLGNNRCLRTHLLVPRHGLVALACGDPEQFPLHKVDCSKL